MPSNQTPNYGLSQWSKSDRVQMADFNTDNAKIDGALGALASTVAGKASQASVNTLSAQVAKAGNCKIWAGTYTGTGTYGLNNPTSLSFPWPPLLVLVLPSAGSPVMWARRDAPYARPLGGEYYHGGSVRLTWQGNNLSWYNEDSAEYQLNASKAPYFVIAFGSAG